MRRGDYPGGPVPPFVPGVEAAGVVDGTDRRVAVVVPSGAHAEYVLADPAACFDIPDGITFEQAAAFPASFVTAYDALVTTARARGPSIAS